MIKAYIFLNGELPIEKSFYENLKGSDIFCADGGAKNFVKYRIKPKEVWGDFDSLDKDEIEWLSNNEVLLKKFNSDKDFTDGELLIEYVTKLGYDKVYIYGGWGGRIDHTLTNINLVFKYDNIIFKGEKEELFKVQPNDRFYNLEGKTVSFIPMSDRVEGLTLIGFQYLLKDFLLKRGASLCMSNVIVENRATINFRKGELLAIINY